MRRFAPVVMVLMIPIVLVLALPALAQNGAQDESPAGAKAGSAPANSLDAEIAQLRRLVVENQRRIAALEARLAEMSGKPATEPPSDSAEGDGAAAPASVEQPARAASSELGRVEAQPAEGSATDLPLWAREESWRALTTGMDEDEVRALLGAPDSTREFGFSRKLIYKGDVPGRGFLRGTVSFLNGEVSDIDRPDF